MRNGESILNDPNYVSAHVVNHFTNLFTTITNIVQNGLIEEVISNLITYRINDMLTLLPSNEEIQTAIFSFNSDSALGPDGFRALIFQTYWEIIKHDVIKVVL